MMKLFWNNEKKFAANSSKFYMKILILDECGFNQDMVPTYGYERKDKNIREKTKPKSTNISLLLTHSETKIYGF